LQLVLDPPDVWIAMLHLARRCSVALAQVCEPLGQQREYAVDDAVLLATPYAADAVAARSSVIAQRTAVVRALRNVDEPRWDLRHSAGPQTRFRGRRIVATWWNDPRTRRASR